MQQLGPDGLLPPGTHDATMSEIELQFGPNPHRRNLIQQLRRLVALARRLGFVREIYVDGSFVTGRTDPNDIDIVLGIEDLPNPSDPLNVRERTLRVRALRRVGGSALQVFPFPLDDWKFSDMLEFFQTERPEDGGREKGIVRLVGWQND